MQSPLDVITRNAISLFVIPQESHVSSFNNLAGILERTYGHTCIVSYLRPASTLAAQFDKEGIDPRRFFFIDTLTSGVKQPGNTPNTLFIRSPADLTELSLGISEVLRAGVFKALLFDGVDAMLVYQEHEPVVRFIHSIITKCSIQGVHMVFTVAKGATHSEIIKDLHMFVDEVVWLDGEPADALVEATR